MKQNKLKFIVSFLFLGMILFSSCKEDDIDDILLSNLELNQSELQLSIGEVQAIIASATPENATENVLWTSSDESVAQIQFNEAGLVAGVKGISLGNATLTATSQNGTITKTILVNVIIKVESIELEEIVSANPSETSYNVIFTPEDASIKDVIWSSSDPSIIAVDQNGNVTAVSPGVAVITATTVQGEKTASVELAASGNPTILGLQYCSISGTGSYNADSITTSGADANLNHNAGQPANNYGFYENEIIIAQPGSTFELSLVQSNTWSMTLIYIDWNGDKDFMDDDEIVQQFGLPSQLNDGPFNATINVPLNAVIGKVRMRVLTGDAWTTDTQGVPCGEYANSTTKDFDIEIGGVAYCSVSGTGSYNADSVITTGGDTNINHAAGQPSFNYAFYSDEVLSIATGNSFDLSIVQSNNWSMTVVWVDWNNDGDFEEADEQIQIFGLQSQLNDGPFNATIDVPSSAMQGITRMRILTGDAWTTDPGLAPCGEYANSTTKDFIVNVL